MTLTRYQVLWARARAALCLRPALCSTFFSTGLSPVVTPPVAKTTDSEMRSLLPGWLLTTMLTAAVSSTFVFSQPACAQGAPEAAPKAGQVFEEEIVPQRYANNPAVDSFINDLVARYDFDSATLHSIFNQVSYSATAVKLVTPAPATTPSVKNWLAYQQRFIEPIRINGGVAFWQKNRIWLDQASQTYGVPPEIIVAIVGVETLYGKYMGNFRVLDALTTLAFDYPGTPNQEEREALFRKNLEDFLVWTHTTNVDPTTIRGSYAGAIGIPQFMPSSILQYAVDFNNSQDIDLRNQPADAIGSIGNFLRQNGWQAGQPIMWRIGPDVGSQGIAQAAADGKPEPHWALDQLVKAGMLLNEPGLDVGARLGTPVTVVDLPTPGQPTQYALGLQNFYAITRYNRSFFYATTVFQLAQAIKMKMQASGNLSAAYTPSPSPTGQPGGALSARDTGAAASTP